MAMAAEVHHGRQVVGAGPVGAPGEGSRLQVAAAGAPWM
jgi:hypothetical protein